MGFAENLRISGSALSAQRLRMNAISNNLANAQTTRTSSGKPYQRQEVVFEPMFRQNLMQRLKLSQSNDRHLAFNMQEHQGGVKAVQVSENERPGTLVYEPSHPDANDEGYVEYPNINVIEEMTDMISASRSYEANVQAVQSARALALKALEIGRA